VPRRKILRNFSANHALDKLCLFESSNIPRGDIMAIAEHGDAFGKPVHILDPVGDEDDGNALVA